MEETHILALPGGGIAPLNGILNTSTGKRCEAAVRAWKAQSPPLHEIVTLGAVAHPPYIQTQPTASISGHYLRNHTGQYIYEIPNGRDTFEEMKYLVGNVKGNKRWNNPVIYVVTHRLHGERCMYILQEGYGMKAAWIDAGYEISQREEWMEQAFMRYTHWDPRGEKWPAELMRRKRTYT